MSVEFAPAKREAIPLLIGLAGGTGSGKTYSALRLARGISGGAPFHVIDTENGRAKHYADEFDFLHTSLSAPFKPSRYAEAIHAAEAQGARLILVDSTSHSWTGEGGVLEWHDQLEGGDARKKMLAWQKPKADHRIFQNALLQTKAHVILCFRASPKVEMKVVNGKTEVVPKQRVAGGSLDGWIPEADPRLPYEMTLSFLLMADAPGVPKPIKLPDKLRPFVSLDAPLDEATGERLAAWAKGSGAEPSPTAALAAAGAGGSGTEPAPSASVEPGASESPPAGAPEISQAQRKRLFAIARERGVEEMHLRSLILELTGQQSTAGMSIPHYESLVTLIESREKVSA